MNRLALRGAVTVAAVYGYFLLFAEFAFVELFRAGGVAGVGEKTVLGTMAVAGILSGFLVARRGADQFVIRLSLGVAGLAAVLASVSTGLPAAICIALATGSALGCAAVSLAALLRGWCGLPWIGLGTGVGYAVCNIPVVFTSSPEVQTWIAAGMAAAGALAVPPGLDWKKTSRHRVLTLPVSIAVFTALVWLDSAAFFIIQHNSTLKAGTWGDHLLWRDAAIHLMAAVVAGFWLMRGGARMLPTVTWVVLGIAALALGQSGGLALAGWLYPLGVSLYSTALVAWPGWFSGAENSRQAGWRAAWMFGIAGWFGSANGLGMAQSLDQVPGWFVGISGLVIVCGSFFFARKHWRIGLTLAAIALVFLLVERKSDSPTGTAVERGRQVYISEGCIACHSQYIRPGSHDEDLWGKSAEPDAVLNSEPVLIGNRRNGPDLSTVGVRRSAAWMKAHFIDPRAFSNGSTMPSYAHLFRDGRGDDLVSYLCSLGIESMGDHLTRIAEWEPDVSEKSADGKALFSLHCAVCHGEKGKGDGPQMTSLTRPPANLVEGPFIWSRSGPDQMKAVARIIKFGIPGTDMPGHEVLSDANIADLTDYVLEFRKSMDR